MVFRLATASQERQVAETFEPEPFSAESQTRLAPADIRVEPLGAGHNGMISTEDQHAGRPDPATGDDLLKCWSFGVTSLRGPRKACCDRLRLRGE